MSDNARPILYIYCDGGGMHGFGHIRRSITLSHKLEEDGFLVSIIGLSPNARKFLPAPASQNLMPKVVVFDCPPGVGIDEMKSVNTKYSMTVALDWFNTATLPIVNISVFPHHPVLSLSKSFIGLKYILIRPEIQHAKNQFLPQDNGYVLVSIGGSDLMNQGRFISNKLAGLGYRVLLVRGPMNNDYSTESLAPGVQVVNDPSNFSELMAQSKFVVSNGGGCLFEALYLGKAAVAIPQTPFEQRIIELIQGTGGILGSGEKDLKFFTESEIVNVGMKAEKIIDGSGAARISSIILAELNANYKNQN